MNYDFSDILNCLEEIKRDIAIIKRQNGGKIIDKEYSVKETAKLLSCSRQYVRELITKRKLKAFQNKERGPYRITETALQEYKSQRLKN
jgi:excisionase family DNA binding protein